MRNKKQPNPRKWRCQGILAGEQCRDRAMLEISKILGAGTFGFPVKVKLCPPCGKKFSRIARNT